MLHKRHSNEQAVIERIVMTCASRQLHALPSSGRRNESDSKRRRACRLSSDVREEQSIQNESLRPWEPRTRLRRTGALRAAQACLTGVVPVRRLGQAKRYFRHSGTVISFVQAAGVQELMRVRRASLRVTSTAAFDLLQPVPAHRLGGFKLDDRFFTSRALNLTCAAHSGNFGASDHCGMGLQLVPYHVTK
jgi:hypothetical protein